jgi:O-antigen/teichoic acid export membrane protein
MQSAEQSTETWNSIRVRQTSVQLWSTVEKATRATWLSACLRGRIARGAVWTLIGSTLAQLSTLVSSVIIARQLGQESFGKYGMILNTVGMLGVFAGLELGRTSTKYVAEFRLRDPIRAGRIIALSEIAALASGTMLGLGLYVFASRVAAESLNAPGLADQLRVASFLLAVNALCGAQTGALCGFEAFKALARINILRGLAGIPTTAICVFYWGLPGALWALTIIGSITLALSQVELKKQCELAGVRVLATSAWSEVRMLWSFATPMVLSGAVVGAANWAACGMLVHQPNGYSEMGIFSAASQWRNVVCFVPGVLSQLALPLLSNLRSERELLKYEKALRWTLIATSAIAVAAAALISLTATRIMQTYGKDFRDGSLVLIIVSVTAVLSSVNAVVGTAILSSGSAWVGLWFNLMWAAILLAVCYVIVPTHFATGLAVAMLTAYLAHTIWQSVYLRNHLSKSKTA